jgi:hypothetical protein
MPATDTRPTDARRGPADARRRGDEAAAAPDAPGIVICLVGAARGAAAAVASALFV